MNALLQQLGKTRGGQTMIIGFKICLFVYVAGKAAELTGADKAGNWQAGLLWTAGVIYAAWQLFKVLERDHDK